MSDRRYNLSERDRLLIAMACRSLASSYRADAKLISALAGNTLAENAAQLEHLADTMATSALTKDTIYCNIQGGRLVYFFYRDGRTHDVSEAWVKKNRKTIRLVEIYDQVGTGGAVT